MGIFRHHMHHNLDNTQPQYGLKRGLLLTSIADQKKRIREILDADRFEDIMERTVSDSRGRVYLTKNQVGKEVIVVVVGPSPKSSHARGSTDG